MPDESIVCMRFCVLLYCQALTADPVSGLNFSSVFVTTAFFLKKSKSMVMRTGLTETVTVVDIDWCRLARL